MSIRLLSFNSPHHRCQRGMQCERHTPINRNLFGHHIHYSYHSFISINIITLKTIFYLRVHPISFVNLHSILAAFASGTQIPYWEYNLLHNFDAAPCNESVPGACYTNFMINDPNQLSHVCDTHTLAERPCILYLVRCCDMLLGSHLSGSR